MLNINDINIYYIIIKGTDVDNTQYKECNKIIYSNILYYMILVSYYNISHIYR